MEGDLLSRQNLAYAGRGKFAESQLDDIGEEACNATVNLCSNVEYSKQLWIRETISSEVILDQRTQHYLLAFVSFNYYDSTKPICPCGCQTHIEVNTCIGNLCSSLLSLSSWDYAKFKRSFDACIRVISAVGIPEIPKNAFMTFARQLGVTNYAWAIVDVSDVHLALKQIFMIRKRNFGIPLRYIISMGAGNGYVESVFARAITSMNNNIQVIPYDVYPSPTPYIPIRKGKPLNIFTDFATTADCILLLCWPPLGTPLEDGSYNPAPDPNHPTNTMASDSLKFYASKGGRFLIYIGERTVFGCTGDPAFHCILQNCGWVLVNEDEQGNSTIPMDKWCPQHTSIPTGYPSVYHQIGGVSGNDSMWIYYLQDNSMYVNYDRSSNYPVSYPYAPLSNSAAQAEHTPQLPNGSSIAQQRHSYDSYTRTIVAKESVPFGLTPVRNSRRTATFQPPPVRCKDDSENSLLKVQAVFREGEGDITPESIETLV